MLCWIFKAKRFNRARKRQSRAVKAAQHCRLCRLTVGLQIASAFYTPHNTPVNRFNRIGTNFAVHDCNDEWRRDLRIGLDNALGIHPDALNLRAQRTEVLARNIANADTPGYKSRDFDFHAVLQAQTAARSNNTSASAQVQRTHAQHLVDDRATAQSPELAYRVPLMPSLDGNTVEAQVEQAKFAENALQFQASLQFTNSKFRGLLTAIKGE